jgi:hypothetical protein
MATAEREQNRMSESALFRAKTEAKIELWAREKRSKFATEHPEIAFMSNELIQCTLPHRNPGATVTTYTRTNGLIKVIVDSGKDPRTLEPYGVPFGTLPRLLLYYVITEAVRTRSKRIYFGRNLHAFMRTIGLNPNNGSGKRSDYRRLIDQANRLFTARITVAPVAKDAEKRYMAPRADMLVAKYQDLWWSPNTAEQDSIFQSYIDLDEDFLDAIISSPVPVQLEAIREIKDSPMALDLYGWATYRTYLVNQKGKAERIPFAALKHQFGADYTDQKEFNRSFKKALQRVKSVYPKFAYDDKAAPGVLIVFPGETAVLSAPE